MAAVKLQTLSVKHLKPGMVLHSIVKQTGRLEVKSKGKIRHKGVIEQLIASGVKSVKIELADEKPSKAGKVTTQNLAKRFEAANDDKVEQKPAIDLHAPPPKLLLSDILVPEDDFETIELDDFHSAGEVADDSIDDAGKGHAQTTPAHKPSAEQAPSVKKEQAPPKLNDKANSKREHEKIEQLVIDCKRLHNKLKLNIEKKAPVDLSESKTIVSNLHANLMEDPEVLLCLSMIRNDGEYLSNHAMHTSVLLCHFAKFLGMSAYDCKRLALLGFFFDIGMLQVPKEILHKQGVPSPNEQKIIQSHVQKSLDLLAPLELDSELVLAIEQHHERLDGSGYPNQLQGEDIHKFARMLAIVDCYDAMTTNRPFQKKSSPAAALKLITNKAYGYDLKLALQFVRCIGVYPVGSLVILSNQQIALVVKNYESNALKPKLKVFYSIDTNDYIEPVNLDLSKTNSKLTILKPTLAEHHRLDLERVTF
ncbi:HD domain-containing phosphohydrolase [Glaciecola siphonariae]|uniref:HD domain-containing phosphohydrolase n=1 Tax=Glaciecola siphonariae TaxID=521012 RepID=A0ABV9LSV5_9ALTE